MKDFGHPAMFPEELPRRLMKLFSYKNDIILDPFNGAGTTTLVAWKLKRRFIGIDTSGQYCRTALDRLISAPRASRVSSGYPSPAIMSIDQ
jgi:site-specific DNA-methyltransferase (adenine-specific)